MTIPQIEKLIKSGHIKGYRITAPVKGSKPIPASPHRGIEFIKEALHAANINYVLEYRFYPTRKFRFDIAIPEMKIAIEYEGIYSNKSRHTTQSGYTKDCEKYTLAAIDGWRVMRYTASNYKDFENDLKNILK